MQHSAAGSWSYGHVYEHVASCIGRFKVDCKWQGSPQRLAIPSLGPSLWGGCCRGTRGRETTTHGGRGMRNTGEDEAEDDGRMKDSGWSCQSQTRLACLPCPPRSRRSQYCCAAGGTVWPSNFQRVPFLTCQTLDCARPDMFVSRWDGSWTKIRWG